jgi:predicted DsbA family dithiol-disulfide isomerase
MTGTPKAPNTPQNPRVGSRLRSAGQQSGIDFTGKCDFVPNTIRAHVLLELALAISPAIQDLIQERLFYAYFTGGEDVNDVNNLVTWATEAKMDGAAVRSALEGSGFAEAAQGAMQQAQSARQQCAGFSGVPYWYFNGDKHNGFSGAIPAQSLLKIFAQIAARQ